MRPEKRMGAPGAEGAPTREWCPGFSAAIVRQTWIDSPFFKGCTVSEGVKFPKNFLTEIRLRRKLSENPWLAAEFVGSHVWSKQHVALWNIIYFSKVHNYFTPQWCLRNYFVDICLSCKCFQIPSSVSRFISMDWSRKCDYLSRLSF